MKRGRVLVLLILLIGLISNTSISSLSQDESGPLVIYTYSSFVSFGMADVVANAFRDETGEDVRFVATADSRAMLSRLIAERDASGEAPADVFLGVEINDQGTAQEHDVFESVSLDEIPNLEFVSEEIRFDAEQKLIPYEHGFITLVYDSQALAPEDVPQTLKELIDPKYDNEIIMIDPRTSSPGLSFMLWSIHEFGEPTWLGFWEDLNENLLLIADSWDASFDLFQRGEASIIVSFSTDNAFDAIVNDSDRIQVVTPKGQGYRTIFSAGVVKDASRPQLAREFINILLSTEVQSKIAETEYMIPANVNATARAIWFQNLVIPSDPLLLPSVEVRENLDRWLEEWVNRVLAN